jgi:hypothetical protein
MSSETKLSPVITLKRPADNWALATPENPLIRMEVQKLASPLIMDGLEPELQILADDVGDLMRSSEMINYINSLRHMDGFVQSDVQVLIYGLNVSVKMDDSVGSTMLFHPDLDLLTVHT